VRPFATASEACATAGAPGPLIARPWISARRRGSLTPRMPIHGACAARSSQTAGSPRRPTDEGSLAAPCRRVLRGGSWNNKPENLRSANRNRNNTDNRNNNIGFRVASTPSCRSFCVHGRAGRAEVRPGWVMMSRLRALPKPGRRPSWAAADGRRPSCGAAIGNGKHDVTRGPFAALVGIGGVA
jgi:Sulfatase-modifying factor enzyme 1